VASGVYPDFAAAVAQTVHFDRRIEPDPKNVAAYNQKYPLYRQVYPALIELQRQL
jgi:sugar (pentulose or hexulose) kinase